MGRCKNCDTNIELTDVVGHYSGVCKDCQKILDRKSGGSLFDLDVPEDDSVRSLHRHLLEYPDVEYQEEGKKHG